MILSDINQLLNEVQILGMNKSLVPQIASALPTFSTAFGKMYKAAGRAMTPATVTRNGRQVVNLTRPPGYKQNPQRLGAQIIDNQVVQRLADAAIPINSPINAGVNIGNSLYNKKLKDAGKELALTAIG